MFVKGLGKKKSEKLNSAGINAVDDILNTPEPPSDFTKKAWEKILYNVPTNVDISPPPPTNHAKADNPCSSLHGQEWENKIKTFSGMSTYCDVRDMITRIYEETKKACIGSPFESNFYFYHDALSQMNNTETIEWMKMKGYHKHWILPENGYNEGTACANHPAGNTPEIMPLDASSLNDLDEAIQ